jgi:hypothetical protein
MNKQLSITTNTEALSRLRFQNDCLTNYLIKLSSKDEICEILKYLNHSVSQITNLYHKEIEDYEQNRKKIEFPELKNLFHLEQRINTNPKGKYDYK